MHILVDDKGAQDIADFCKVYLSVDVYIQYLLSQPVLYDGPLEEEDIDTEDILNHDE